MARIGAIECQVVRILDADGTLLTVATAGPLDDEGMITLDEVDDHGVLIDYYFGRGERLVVVERDGRTVEGVLDTRWLVADRVWWIGVSPSRAAQTLARVTVFGHEPARVDALPVDALPVGALPLEDARTDHRVPAPLTG
jgi:hypothetical protein